jgi:hypothetical protein
MQRISFLMAMFFSFSLFITFSDSDPVLAVNESKDIYLIAQAAPQGGVDWAKRYNDLRDSIEPNMDEPKGYPGRLEPYLTWLERKARDRDEVKKAMEDAFNAAHGNPEWGEKFDNLLKMAQRSGENTAWDACFKFLRIKKDDDWQNTLYKARNFGRIIYQKAAETRFDPVHVREQWVRCLVRYAINNIEVAKFGLYDGRTSVFGEFDEEGLLVIPKRDFNVNCERRIDFKILEKGDPITPLDKGLEWLEDVRKECDWWQFGLERTDVTKLMVEYFKDCLCFLPGNKSHNWYVELAKKYRLEEAREYAEGFYATLKGTVWIKEGEDRKPASYAEVKVVDPKDGKTWKTNADNNGKYKIKDALLHAHKDAKGRVRCPVFKIFASHEGSSAEDTFKGTLQEPNRGAELTKDLVIKRKGYTVTVDLEFTAPYIPDGAMRIAELQMHVVFEDVFIEAGNKEDPNPIMASGGIDWGEVRGTFRRFVLQDTWTSGDANNRERPKFISGKEPPTSFEASLTLEDDLVPEMENSRDGKRSVSIRLSEKRTLIFRTDMRRNLPEWGNSVGGTRLDDFNLDFEVPWNDLLAGKPVTIKLPYMEDEEKGSWTIQFTPGR